MPIINKIFLLVYVNNVLYLNKIFKKYVIVNETNLNIF
jgi:hypothetical protein